MLNRSVSTFLFSISLILLVPAFLNLRKCNGAGGMHQFGLFDG
jgi:hypothetical protein